MSSRKSGFRAMECRYLSAKGGDGCGLARFLVALGGGDFVAAKMSADDRGSTCMGRLQEVYSGESLGLVKLLCSAKGKSVGNTRYRDLNSDTSAYPSLTCPLYTSPIYVPLLHASPLCVPLLPDTHVPFTVPPATRVPFRAPLLHASPVRVPLPRASPVRVPLPRASPGRVPLPCHAHFLNLGCLSLRLPRHRALPGSLYLGHYLS